MIRLRPSGADEVLIKRVRDWYEPGPGVFIAPQALFSPALLFTTGVNGAWYDPSDLTTLFRDAAGTTPVTAVEQPVGLMLDKSKGLVLGPELVTNGTFDSASDWALGAGWSISGGVASANPATGIINQNAYYTRYQTGKTYIVTVTISSYTSGYLQCYLRGNLGSIATNVFNSAKTWMCIATAGSSTTEGIVLGFGGFVGSIDNISVRELPGNHAFNSSGNSANFPVLSARYNLLTNSEASGAVVGSPGVMPVGWNIAQTPAGCSTQIVQTGTINGVAYCDIRLVGMPTNTNALLIEAPSAVVSAAPHTLSFSLAKVSGALTPNIGLSGGGGVGASFSAVSITESLARVSATWSLSAGRLYPWIHVPVSLGVAVDVTIRFAAADLRVSNDALNQPAYQRVNTATDYDTAGFKPYLKFNGVNQWLQTNSIDFTYGDKMFVCAGVRKLSDAARGIVAELSTSYANPGTFGLNAPDGASATYGWHIDGANSWTDTLASMYAAPITNVISATGNTSGVVGQKAALRVNGLNTGVTTGNTDPVNFGNYPLYIGARAGSSLWFNGRLHQLVVAGKQASASEISSTETYINQKTGAY